MEPDIVEYQEKLEEFKNSSETAVSVAPTMLVTDDMTHQLADSYVKTLTKEINKIKEYFTPRKKRAKEVHSDWVAAEKASLKDLDQAKGMISGRISAYVTEKVRKSREETRIQKEKAAESGIDPGAVVGPPLKTEGVSGMREIWDVEIVDASLIPREYLVPDVSALKALATAKKDAFSVPGVKAGSRMVRAGR